jgi:hypothetical protein
MKQPFSVHEVHVGTASKHFLNKLPARQTLGGASAENCRHTASRLDVCSENFIKSDAAVVIAEAGHDHEIAVAAVMFPHPCSL